MYIHNDSANSKLVTINESLHYYLGNIHSDEDVYIDITGTIIVMGAIVVKKSGSLIVKNGNLKAFSVNVEGRIYSQDNISVLRDLKANGDICAASIKAHSVRSCNGNIYTKYSLSATSSVIAGCGIVCGTNIDAKQLVRAKENIYAGALKGILPVAERQVRTRRCEGYVANGILVTY